MFRSTVQTVSSVDTHPSRPMLYRTANDALKWLGEIAGYRGTYEQKHVREECACGGKEVDTALLIEIIERDRIPVFSWDSVDKKLSIASSHMVQRGVSYPAYIAISHV